MITKILFRVQKRKWFAEADTWETLHTFESLGSAIDLLDSARKKNPDFECRLIKRVITEEDITHHTFKRSPTVTVHSS